MHVDDGVKAAEIDHNPDLVSDLGLPAHSACSACRRATSALA